MPRKATTAETIRINTVEEMKSIGTYKPEYHRVIEVYCSLLEKYIAINKEIKQEDYQARTPLCISEEALRKDILKYMAELGLTPAGLKRINDKAFDKKKQSQLAKALNALG